MPMSDTFSRVEVITGVARRRRFTTEQKLAVVAETMQPGMSISYVARRHGLSRHAKLTETRTALERDKGAAGTSAIHLGARLLSPDPEHLGPPGGNRWRS